MVFEVAGNILGNSPAAHRFTGGVHALAIAAHQIQQRERNIGVVLPERLGRNEARLLGGLGLGGACTEIPSMGASEHRPPRADVRTPWGLEERYGLVFLAPEKNPKVARVTYDAIQTSGGIMVIVGIAACVLGVLALLAVGPVLVLTLVALLAIGAALLFAGGALTARLVRPGMLRG